MPAWMWIVVALAAAGAAWAIVSALTQRADARPGRAARRILDEPSAPRVPLRPGPPAGPSPGAPPRSHNLLALLQENAAPEPPARSNGVAHAAPADDPLDDDARTVLTPDGPMTLTRPPFRLRRSVMNHRERLYAREVSLRLPPGYVLCPQVRLESLLTPTAPRGEGLEHWRAWRRRVRLRAVDFVVCRMSDWAPVVALEIEGPRRVTPRQTVDRMTDEALAEVGLPLVRCFSTPEEDWPAIAPYLA